MSTYVSEDEEAILLKEIEEIVRVVEDLSASNSEFERELAGLREENKELKTSVETVLKESMERNIVIRGLPDSLNETWQKLLQTVKKLILSITKKKGFKIETVLRIGQFELGYTRQVRVIFRTICDRNAVFNSPSQFPSKYVIDADTLSPILRDIDEDFQVEANGIKFLKTFELAMSDIVIGSGEYGSVFAGTAKGVQVALKKYHLSRDKTDVLQKELKQVKLHSNLSGHPNILEFVGVYLKDMTKGTLTVAYELCASGTLERYLRQKSHVSNNPNINSGYGSSLFSQTETIDFFDLLRFTLEISKALEYIKKMDVVHGDVAIRNVLLNSNLTCKLSNFDLSRDLYNYETYFKKNQEPLPWRWMAYESLVRMEFSSKSDVWSFGVAVWEIFSLGKLPYEGLTWTTTFVDHLRNGFRLPMPKCQTVEIYNKLVQCWNIEKDLRPNIDEMVGFFTPLGNRAKSNEDYVNI